MKEKKVWNLGAKPNRSGRERTKLQVFFEIQGKVSILSAGDKKQNLRPAVDIDLGAIVLDRWPSSVAGVLFVLAYLRGSFTLGGQALAYR